MQVFAGIWYIQDIRRNGMQHANHKLRIQFEFPLASSVQLKDAPELSCILNIKPWRERLMQ